MIGSHSLLHPGQDRRWVERPGTGRHLSAQQELGARLDGANHLAVKLVTEVVAGHGSEFGPLAQRVARGGGSHLLCEELV